MSGMRKVFWVTSYFPPQLNVATIRNVKFLKYLPYFGWKAVVICPRETSENTPPGKELLSQLSPSITISVMPQDLFLYLERHKSTKRIPRYAAYVMNNILPPDGHIFWSLTALRHIGREIIRNKPDMIYTTCSPFSLNVIGAWLKFKYNIPWVTDFRDLWLLNPMSRRIFKPYHDFVSRRLEPYFLRYCDALIVTTEKSKDRMTAVYSFLKEKTFVIPNGFDQEDIPTDNEEGLYPNSFFYSGSIYYKTAYTPAPILKLLSKLANDGFFDEPWQLHYAGSDGEAFVDLVRQERISAECKDYGFLDPQSLYRLIHRMAYVMLCMPRDADTMSWVPARLYDYIGNNCRLICLTSRESELARLIEPYGNGITLFYDEPEDIQVQKFQAFLAAHKNDSTASKKFIERFSRKNLTMQLSKIFQHIINS